MSFIAQVRLPDVKPYDSQSLLPERGILSFFYDSSQTAWGYLPKHGNGCKVFWFDEPDVPLVRTSFPPELPKGSGFLPCALRPSAEPTLPQEEFLIAELDLRPGEREAYDALCEWVKTLSEVQIAHRLLGYPDQIQDAMEDECQLASNGIDVGGTEGYGDPRVPSLRLGTKDWRLLLQVDSEEAAQMMWGDSGRVYFWIRSQDLEHGEFDRVWPVLQCG